MTQLRQLIRHLEQVAPPVYQESYDNAGLITGNPDQEVTGVLVCLDSTEAVIREAAAEGCNVVVAHHPIIFKGLKRLTGQTYVERTVIEAIRHGIAVYAIHTNLDNVYHQGVNSRIAEKLGLIGRSTVKDVYDQVIADLVKAETLLENAGTNGSSISTYAVSAILSRVYLQQGEFAKAAQSADRVIQSGEYSLNANPLRAFNSPSNSSEDVFAIQQTALSNAGTSNGGLATFYARLNGSGRGDMQVQEAFFDLFEPGDRRGQLEEDLPTTATIANVNEMYYIGVGGQNAGNIQCAKYGDGNLNIQIIRLAELYLNRAEANFEAGTSVGASPLSDINTIRERAGLAPLLIVTRQDIRDERQRELAFEGFRLHDKKRWKEDVEDLPYDSPKLVLPIPERELEVYDIEQNPGYE